MAGLKQRLDAVEAWRPEPIDVEAELRAMAEESDMSIDDVRKIHEESLSEVAAMPEAQVRELHRAELDERRREQRRRGELKPRSRATS